MAKEEAASERLAKQLAKEEAAIEKLGKIKGKSRHNTDVDDWNQREKEVRKEYVTSNPPIIVDRNTTGPDITKQAPHHKTGSPDPNVYPLHKNPPTKGSKSNKKKQRKLKKPYFKLYQEQYPPLQQENPPTKAQQAPPLSSRDIIFKVLSGYPHSQS